jgi:hypothetical protein
LKRLLKTNNSQMATVTPPLRPVTEPPPAPLHGSKADNWDSYRGRRRSSRLQSMRTPSPSSLDKDEEVIPLSRRNRASHNSSPPSSPTSPESSNPRKRTYKGLPKMTSHQVHDDQFDKKGQINNIPSPMKTPTNRSIREPNTLEFLPLSTNHAQSSATAYSHTRRTRFSLYSPAATSDIDIFVDSKERIPEVDTSKENPFYESPETRGRRAREQTKKKTTQDESMNVDDSNKDDGMWYML